MSRHVELLVYNGFDLLDLSGPLEVFQWAEGLHPGNYRWSVVSAEGGEIASATGLSVVTEKYVLSPVDTLVVVGGRSPITPLPEDVISYVRNASSSARRTASVCTGAFILAAAGLLDNKPATTHWLYSSQLQELYPLIRVNGDRIFTQEAGVWTSAGITAGIDLCLALIEEDLGVDIAKQVARSLVVYYRRPGGQRQYSSLIDLHSVSERVANVLSYARENLGQVLTVERLAEVANLSVRQFARAFQAATGSSPAKAIERIRTDAARARIEDGQLTLEQIAREVGFGDARRMRQSFLRIYGHPPQAVRRLSRSSV